MGGKTCANSPLKNMDRGLKTVVRGDVKVYFTYILGGAHLSNGVVTAPMAFAGTAFTAFVHGIHGIHCIKP